MGGYTRPGTDQYGEYEYDEKPKRKARRGDEEDVFGEPRTFEWHEAWIAAVTQPGVATFEALIRDPRARFMRAALWIAALLLAGYLVQFGMVSLFGLSLGSLDTAIGSTILFVICAPVAVLLGFLGLTIGWGSQHLAAKVLGGKGTFEQLFYANSCYYAPLMVASVVTFVPCLGTLVALGLLIYQLTLNVISMKAVHGMDWGRSVVACFWLIVVLCGCMICAVMMLAPSASSLQQFIESLYTATPIP